MSNTLVVVPTYNERENLPPLAQRLLALPVPVDMLVVDDNSPDGTGKIADELSAKHPSIHVLHRTEKSGLGRAYGLSRPARLPRDEHLHPVGWGENAADTDRDGQAHDRQCPPREPPGTCHRSVTPRCCPRRPAIEFAGARLLLALLLPLPLDVELLDRKSVV